MVFSRKGFDSSAGGGPSPIVDGRALSLPIPAGRGASATTYGNLRLGGHASRASGGRLTVPGGPLTLWQVPPWLAATGLSYHGRADRWLPGSRLQSVSRGQEFVADIGERADAREWLREIIAAIEV